MRSAVAEISEAVSGLRGWATWCFAGAVSGVNAASWVAIVRRVLCGTEGNHASVVQEIWLVKREDISKDYSTFMLPDKPSLRPCI